MSENARQTASLNVEPVLDEAARSADRGRRGGRGGSGDEQPTGPINAGSCAGMQRSGDGLNGFRCFLLRCPAVTRSRVQECGDLWSHRFSLPTKDSWDAYY